MRKGYIATYAKTFFIILIIIAIVVAVGSYLRKQYGVEQTKDIKTDMLLVQGKIKILSEKVKIKEKGVKYIGTKLEDVKGNEDIKLLIEKKIIEIDAKDAKYYVLNNDDLKKLELENINLDEGVYIVDYKTDEIIYSKGVVTEEGNILYKLSEM